MGKKSQTIIKEYLMIAAGTALIAFAVASIYDPSGFVTGGFSGLAIIVKQLTEDMVPGGIPLAVTNLLLNIPVFLIAIRLKGWNYIVKTLFGTVMLSFWLGILPVIPLAEGDLLLTALYGGVVMGVGIGLVFLSQATTGGTDLIAAIVQHFWRHYSIADIMQVIDAVIVLAGAYLFSIQMALYAVISIYLVSKVSDGIIEGLKFSKAAFIITQRPDELAQILMDDLSRGVTGLSARGMYSGQEKNMLFCVVSRKEIVRLKELTLALDPDAFVIVSDVREVLGEGFIETK
ncbi:YitT family protein [bacterium 1XD21-13]|nr:YitT family protein [bacterium 1XD21-13]